MSSAGGADALGGGAKTPTQLSYVDAQRAAAIVEDAVEKLSFLRSVEPDVLTHKEELSAAMGDEVERVMQRQAELEARYRDLLDERSALRGEATAKQRLATVEKQIADVDRELRDVTKSLSRALKDNPRVGDNLRKMVAERNQLMELLSMSVKELRSGTGQLGAVERFVREEQEARQLLEGLKEEEDALTQSVETLRAQMVEERKKHEAMASELREKIDAIKALVRESKETTTAVAHADQRRAAASTQALGRTHALAEARLRREIDELETRRAIEEGAFAQTSGVLTAEQAGLAARVTAETERAAEAIAEAEERCAALEREREAKREKLAALMERWEEETSRERAEAEAQRAAEIQRRKDKAKQQQRERAAETLRAILPDAFDLVRAFAPKKKGKKGKK
jgi:cell division protein FtsB